MSKRRTVILTLTEECNLNCIYCYQNNKRNKPMSIDLAKEQITKHIHAATKYDEVILDLTGGEVFLHFDLLKELCEWTWAQEWPKPMLFFATTNGTLVHGEIQEWLAKHREKFWICLSLDGTCEMHNTNRSNSYELIDQEFFLKNWPLQTIKMTVSPKTLPDLSKGVIYLTEKGFRVNSNFAHLCDWSKSEHKDILKRELRILADYFIEHKDKQVINLLDMPLNLMICNRNIPSKWCGTGEQLVTVDFDGNEYPCPLFTPSSMGTKINWKSFDLIDPEKLQDPGCRGCIISHSCPNCYGANIIENGTPAIREKNLCEFIKIRALATSYLVGKKLANGLLKIDNQTELNNTIHAIREIQKTLIV